MRRVKIIAEIGANNRQEVPKYDKMLGYKNG